MKLNNEYSKKGWLSQSQNEIARKNYFYNKHRYTGIKVIIVSIIIAVIALLALGVCHEC